MLLLIISLTSTQCWQRQQRQNKEDIRAWYLDHFSVFFAGRGLFKSNFFSLRYFGQGSSCWISASSFY
jgi:hypothetical protein